MAAVQSGQSETEEEKEIQPETSNDGSRTDGRPPAGSPGGPASSPGAVKPSAPGEEETLRAVLRFLQKNNLSESVEILRREAGLTDEPEDQTGSESSGTGSGGQEAGGSVGDAGSLLSRVSVAPTPAAAAAAAAPPPPPPKGPVVPDLLV